MLKVWLCIYHFVCGESKERPGVVHRCTLTNISEILDVVFEDMAHGKAAWQVQHDAADHSQKLPH